MAITLGAEPLKLVLVLVRGSDFVLTLRSEDGDWPETAEISLQVDDGTLITATLDGEDALFEIDKADVDDMIAETPAVSRLWYVDGTTDLLWGKGTVKISG